MQDSLTPDADEDVVEALELVASRFGVDGEFDASTLGPYIREILERERLHDDAFVDVYSSGVWSHVGYPFRCMSAHEARPSAADASGEILIDSGANRLGKINEILSTADRYDAALLTPPDATPKLDVSFSPHEYARELFEHYWPAYQRADVEGTMLLPVQAPYDASVDALRSVRVDDIEPYVDDTHALATDGRGRVHNSGTDVMDGFDPTHMTLDLVEQVGGVAVGGLLALDPAKRIDAIETVLASVPNRCHVHVFAPGTELVMLRYLRSTDAVDSIDVSTPESSAKNGKVADASMSQQRHRFPTGTHSTTVRGAGANLVATTLAFLLGPHVDESLFDELEREMGPEAQVTQDDLPAGVLP